MKLFTIAPFFLYLIVSGGFIAGFMLCAMIVSNKDENNSEG